MLSGHLIVGEFAPALAPAAGLGAGALITLLAWLICFTLAYIWRRSFGAMLQWIADEIDKVRLPRVVGGGHILGPVSSAFRYVDTKVEGSLDYAANHTEHAAVWLFNHAAARFDQLGREIGGLAFDVSVWGHNLIHGVIPRELAATQRVIVSRLDALRARVPALVHAAVHPLVVRVGRLEHTLEHDWEAVRREIARGQARLGKLERLTAREASRLSSLEKALGVAAFAAAVSVALGRLGLRWLKCPSLLRIGSRLGCGGFGFLESLLFFAWETFAVTDLCRFADEMTKLAEELRPLLMEFVDAEEALVGCHGATKPPDLSVPSLVLPPETAGLKLAA